ncbi:MAG: glycosyltransferase [Bryobacteraceae bacterium]|jgi:GT2 family glycosyltransferase
MSTSSDAADTAQGSLPPLDIIIPFYRNAKLVEPLFLSLRSAAAELNEASCGVVAVNDSPGDAQLKPILREAVECLAQMVPVRLMENETNLGFVRAVNAAAAISLAAGHDILLLNSDTVVFPGALSEVKRVAYLDPMIGFVSPRSNNATICSLPQQPEFRNLPPEHAYRNFRDLAHYLPDFHFVPTAVGFCLYIKFRVLAEFGLLDDIYGPGYCDENDLIMRANRGGYRAALANHAFVYHVGEASFSATDSPKAILEKTNAELLNSRYPEYSAAVAEYFAGAHCEAERMLTALLPDSQGRLEVVFDFSSAGPSYDTMFEQVKRMLSAATESWRQYFNVSIMVSEQALRYHKLAQLPRVHFVSPETARIFAVAFRFAQPFNAGHLRRMSRLGVLNVYAMLDPIAFDCLCVNGGLLTIWGTVFQYADGVLYASEFVGEQFRRRFRLNPRLKEMAGCLSLDPFDYAQPCHTADGPGDHILVIGDASEYKRVRATVDALAQAFPREKIAVLGLDDEGRYNVVAYGAGSLSEETVLNLLRNAKFVVFPSLYEGFGIPVLESLALSKPVLARAIPAIEDIRRRIHAEGNLHLYSSTTELVAMLQKGFPQWNGAAGRLIGAESASWQDVTRRIGVFLRGLLSDWSFCDSLVPRLEHMRRLAGCVSPPWPSTSELQAQLRDRDARIANRDACIADRDARIADIYNSASWRITAPLRACLGFLLRFSRNPR